MPDREKADIRPARPQDFEMLTEMYKAHREYHEALGHKGRVSLEKRLAQLRSYISDPEWLALVDMREDSLGGYALATMWTGEKYRGHGYLADIFIAREHRRGGTGAALLKKVEEWLKGKGARGIITEVPSRNISALSFFYRKGYSWAERYDGAVGAYQTAIEDREMTTGELSKFLRLVPRDRLPERFTMTKRGEEAGDNPEGPVVRITVIDGECSGGHSVGDEWLAGKTTPAGICYAAYNAMYPYINGLLHGAKYYWAEPDGSVLVRCPYGKRGKGIIFRLEIEN